MDADELISEVRAALDDLEAHAQKDIWAADQATQGNWRARYGVNLPHSWVETESTPVARLDAARHEADAVLIARFKPDKVRKRAVAVLRQVAADRRVLDRHQPRMLPALPYRPAMAECEYCASLCHSRSGLGCDEPIDAPWPCDEILDLADQLGINPEGMQ